MDAYVQALTWLSRRELSERQIRDRLVRREFDPDEIDTAVARLKSERALDDTRVAVAYARTSARLKGRGRDRIKREIEALGIPKTTAQDAINEAFTEIDETALLTRALDKRWPRDGEPDRRGLSRIYQSLLRQGFRSDQISKAIRTRHSTSDLDE